MFTTASTLWIMPLSLKTSISKLAMVISTTIFITGSWNAKRSHPINSVLYSFDCLPYLYIPCHVFYGRFTFFRLFYFFPWNFKLFLFWLTFFKARKNEAGHRQQHKTTIKIKWYPFLPKAFAMTDPCASRGECHFLQSIVPRCTVVGKLAIYWKFSLALWLLDFPIHSLTCTR